jgi:hypothetical protein
VLRSSGQPLDATTRVDMESRFGHDFSRVRVHSDSRAVESAEQVGARAYTVGHHLVLGARADRPHTAPGLRLLVHELTHILQQPPSSGVGEAFYVGSQDGPAEQQAEQASASRGAPSASGALESRFRPLLLPSRLLQRTATRPRADTGAASIKDVEEQTKGAAGKVTAGSLAATEWESLFKRHFIEPDKIEEEVESSHARYIYSSAYGWIDAQHFFAHIQSAEESGLEASTSEGVVREEKQELVRGMIAPNELDPAGYTLLFDKPELVTPSDVEHYREDLILGFLLAKSMVLSPTEQELIKDFSDEQIAKLLLDNAMSAWSAEDLVSNQLGVQFFRLHGAFINAGADPTEVRKRFLDQLTQFFVEIQVVDSPAEVKRLSRKLPGKERWHAPRMKKERAQKKYPELFEFGKETHRLRIVIHDDRARAEKGKEHIEKVVPSVPGVHIEPLGKQFAVYSGPVSHFEAAIMRMALARAMPVRAKAIVIEPVTTGSR